MVFWKIGWREIRKRPGRSVLTILSIVIGVAAVVAVSIASGTTQRAFDEMYQTVAGQAALEVTAAGGSSFAEHVVELVADTPGVTTAAPMIQRPTIMYFQHRRTKMLFLGIDPERDKSVHDYVVTAGKSLDEAGGVLLDEALARNLGVKPSDEVKLLTRRGLVKARVAGLFTLRGTAATGHGAVLLMPLRAAQYSSRLAGQINSVQIVLAPTANEALVQAEIAKRLPAGLHVHRPAARSTLAEETALSTQQGMEMARAFSLLVATFIITNTFLTSVTQRRRQLGIMRAIGATRRQIATMLYCEALLMGVVGTLLGWFVGAAGARYVIRAMGTLYDTALPRIELTPMSFILAASFGLGMSLLGALLPARRASRLSPMDAMREVLPVEIEGVSTWLTVLGTGLIVICGSVLAACILGWLPIPHSVWSAVLVLTGLVLLMPTVVGPLSSTVAAGIRVFFRVEARLARRQLLRHRARTTLTIGVLFVAISTGIGLASSIIDNVNDVKSWYKITVVADYFVRAMAPDMATGQAADLPDEVGSEIRKIPGITSLETARFVSAEAAGEAVIVVVRDYVAGDEPGFDVVSGSTQGLRRRLHQGDVVIGTVLAERTGLHAGESIPLETDTGTQRLRIAAVVDDYLAGGLTIYMQRDVAKQMLGVTGVDAYIINADRTRLKEVHDALQAVCDTHGLLLQSFSDIQHQIDHMMSGVVAGLWTLVVLGFIVAAFGVANTLTMNVLEQTRELGLLRIVGTTRRQVRRTILAQALIMGILALVPGTAAGISIAYLINLSTVPVIGHPVQFVFHPLLVAGGLLIGLAVVVLAAWFPAERAARLELLDAIRFQ